MVVKPCRKPDHFDVLGRTSELDKVVRSETKLSRFIGGSSLCFIRRNKMLA